MCWLYLHEPATNGAQLNVLLLEMWLIFCGHLWYSNGTSQRFFTGITRIVIVIVINVFYCHRVNQSLSTKEMIWLIELGCICCNVYSVRMNVRVVCFGVFGFVWMGLCVWCLCYYVLTWPFIFYRVGMKWKPHGFLWLSWGICAFDLVIIDYNPLNQVIVNSSTVFSIYYWRNRIRIITHIVVDNSRN